MKYSGILFLLLVGCTSIDAYYAPVDTEGVATADFEGEVVPMMTTKEETELIRDRKATDYVLVGRADFVGPSQNDWQGAMVRKGEEVKAEKIDFRMQYLRTVNNSGWTSVPTTRMSMATVYGPEGPFPVAMTTTENVMIPYCYTIDYNQYHVYFFKKALTPLRRQ